MTSLDYTTRDAIFDSSPSGQSLDEMSCSTSSVNQKHSEIERLMRSSILRVGDLGPVLRDKWPVVRGELMLFFQLISL